MAKVYLTSGATSYVVANTSDSVFGSTGTETISIASGVTAVTVDSNTETVSFGTALSNYKFKQTGNVLSIYDTDGTTLRATVAIDDNGSTVMFNSVSYAVAITDGVMSVGGNPITTSIAAITLTYTVAGFNTAKVSLSNDDTVSIVDTGAAINTGLAGLVTDAAKIDSIADNDTTAIAMTDTQFAVLGSKLADAVVDVTVNAASASADEVAAMVTDVANIGALGITGTGIAMTDTQFATLGSKLADAVVDVTVNAASASAGELTAIFTDIANIGTIDAGGAISLNATLAATVGLGAKITAVDVVTIAGFTVDGAQVIESGVFQGGNDKIVLTKAGVFTALAGSVNDVTLAGDFLSVASAGALTGGSIASATDAAAIIFLQDTGILYYNANGATADGLSAICTLTGVTNGLVTTDFIIA